MIFASSVLDVYALTSVRECEIVNWYDKHWYKLLYKP